MGLNDAAVAEDLRSALRASVHLWAMREDWWREQADGLIAERDRARATAVRLEQENAHANEVCEVQALQIEHLQGELSGHPDVTALEDALEQARRTKWVCE